MTLVKIPIMGWIVTSEAEFGDGNHVHVLWQAFDHDFEAAGYSTRNLRLRRDYGVADNVPQILVHQQEQLQNTDELHFLHVSTIYPSEQPEEGGWRWHKWGHYIGDYESHYEYIYDDYQHGAMRAWFADKPEDQHFVFIYSLYTLERISRELQDAALQREISHLRGLFTDHEHGIHIPRLCHKAAREITHLRRTGDTPMNKEYNNYW